MQWTKSLPDYPATSYVLKYALQLAGQASLITITSTASGSAHAVSVPLATSALYTPGTYTWTSYAQDDADAPTVRYPVERGTLGILPSPLAAQPSTHATRSLALIEAAIEGRIPNGLESTNIDGQQLDRIPVMELQRMRAIYASLVSTEANRAAMAAGLPNRRYVFQRFTRAS